MVDEIVDVSWILRTRGTQVRDPKTQRVRFEEILQLKAEPASEELERKDSPLEDLRRSVKDPICVF